MNEQQIEAACREYCRLRGIDPDYRTKGNPWVNDEQWRIFREKVVEHYLLTSAVQSQQLSQDPGVKQNDV